MIQKFFFLAELLLMNILQSNVKSKTANRSPGEKRQEKEGSTSLLNKGAAVNGVIQQHQSYNPKIDSANNGMFLCAKPQNNLAKKGLSTNDI